MCLNGAVAAGVGEWKTFTGKRDVRDLIVVGNDIWAATSGGLFAYNRPQGTYREFTTSEGLRTINLTSLAADRDGAIWIGAANGIIHRYLPATAAWQYIMDISLLENPQKQINALVVSGDTMFILSDVGVSVYSISRLEFGDSYTRFGNAPGQIVGNVTSIAMHRGKLWISTRNGVAMTSMGNPNPSSPDSWSVFTTANGLPSDLINGLAVRNDSLFAATSNGLAVLAESTWVGVPATIGANVLDISRNTEACVECDKLSFITSSNVWTYSDGAANAGPVSQYPLLSMIGDRFVGSAAGIIESPISSSPLSPPGPPSNRFVGLAVDERGVIWSGTGSRFGEGFMSFDGSTWRWYTSQLYPELGIDEYFKVSIGPGNTKWVSSWGNGVALLDDAGNIRRVFNTTNGLPPTVAPTFVVVGGVATDRNGVAWITNRTAGDQTAVVLFRPDSTLDYSVRMNMRDPLKVFADVVIDRFGTKWFSNYSRFEPEAAVGLYYYNESFGIPGASGGWGLLTNNDGLTTNEVWSLALDRDGALWVGGKSGITIIFNPGNPRATLAQYHPLRDQIIQGIVVDPINNKWVATKQGVFVLSPDGTSVLDRHTVESTNGRLLDNDVASIAMDGSTGMMYFGTERGLSAYSTAAINPVRSFDELTLSPNPYVLPSEVSLTADGLVQGSILKILSVDGKLIRELRTPGGRVGFWDGRDSKNELVGTGIYFVVAYSEDGSKIAKTKLAVIRK